MVKHAARGTILTIIGVNALAVFSMGSVFAVGESASLSSSGVNFEITPTSANPNGTVAIGTDELTVSSTCSSGYKLYISTTSNDENESSLVNTDNSEYSIPAVSGTIASPTLLNSSASKNHWGFAMTSSETGIADTGFLESSNATVTNTSLFSSIPTLDNMTTIRQKTSSADNETVNVYYGVNAGTDLTPGSYSSTVMYTMVMPSPCDYTLMFEDGVSEYDPAESEVTAMPEAVNIGRGVEVNLGDYVSQFTREGYSITGWKNLTDGLTYGATDAVNINTTNADIIKLAPIWTINNYTVSINTVTGISSVSAKIGSGSGTEVNNVSEAVQYGTTVTIAYTLSEGYHFAGWEIANVDKDGSGKPLITEDDLSQVPSSDLYTFTMPASNVELSPKAEGNKYTVHFNGNGGSGTMNDIEMTYGSPSTLPENTFTNGDYEFYGWSKTQQDPGYDVTRDYTNGQTGTFNLIPSNAAGTGETTLYAVWKIASFGEDTMQGWTDCSSLAISTTSNYNDANTYADLRDVRNNVTYRVRRYNDDACWMAENLRLAPGTSDPGGSTINSGALTTTTSTSEAAGSIDFTSTFSTSSYAEFRAVYPGNAAYGAYYNWEAAKLVCPAGWTLPTNVQYSNFLDKESIVDSSAGSSKIENMPYNFPVAGFANDSSIHHVNSDGNYWTKMQYDSSNGYRLYLDNSNVYVAGKQKYLGFPVRCIQINETTMQSFTAAQCAELTASTTDNYEDKSTYRILRDTRNSVFYTVRKYADEKCWMAQNLALTPGSTPPTANVTSGTLTTTTADSQAAGSVSFVSTFSTSSTSFVAQARYDASNSSLSTNTGYYSWTAANLVCPSGWALPTRTEWSDFLSSEGISNNSAGSTLIQSTPFKFAYTGNYGSSLSNTAQGYYWSITDSSSNAYSLNIQSSQVKIAQAGKYGAFPIRCLHS